MKKRKIIVNSNCYHGYSVFDAVDGIAAAGFRNIELTATKGWTEHVFPSMSFSELQDVKDYIAGKGLSIPSMSGHTNLMDEERIPDFIKNIHLAHFFGAGMIVSSIGEAHIADKRKGGLEAIKRNISLFLPLLERYDMRLSLETHGEHGTGFEIKKVVDALGSDRVGICYDTANVIFYGGIRDDKDLISSASSVNYVHLKDKAGDEKEWNFPALGEGYVDFKSLLSVLDESDNPSSLSIEIEFTKDGPSSLEEVNRALRTSAEYLKSMGYEL